jgi:hypothetical protein
MASGQSIAHARLMGAISRKRNRQSAYTDPPEPTAPEGFLLSEAWLVRISRRKPERETRIPGLAPERRVLKARGLPEGTRRKPDTDGRANLEGFAMAARRSRRRHGIFFVIWFAAPCGSANAGGEDFGYFAPGKERVRIPPLMSRTVEAAWRGPLAPRLRLFRTGRT